MGELTTTSTFRQVTRHDLELSRRAYHTLSLLEVPVLQRAEGSRDDLLFALTGTGPAGTRATSALRGSGPR